MWLLGVGNSRLSCEAMEQLLTQFLEHLRYERNVSEHTLRNYASDLNQFLDHLAPAHPQTRKRTPVELGQVDHITIREWLSTLHSAQKKKSSVARKLAALRTFFQFAVREGLLELNPANRRSDQVYRNSRCRNRSREARPGNVGIDVRHGCASFRVNQNGFGGHRLQKQTDPRDREAT